MHVLGMKWSVPILEELYFSTEGMQFNDIQIALRSITARNLSKSLQILQSESMVEKHKIGSSEEQHIVYHLTKRGKEAEEVIESIKRVGISWFGTGRRCTSTKCGTCKVFLGEKHNGIP
jgi:DNA-binding HxlR family transcriptional regulator